MREVTRYQANDGTLFHSKESALEHDQRIDDAHAATEMFAGGATLADALIRAGQTRPGWDSALTADDKVLLMNWRKDDAMAIPHWQCQDERGYKVVRFETNGRLFVWGNAGSWTGPYGNRCELSDVIRYMRDSLKVAK